MQTERDKRKNGEVMLDGVEVIEVATPADDDFEDSEPADQVDEAADRASHRCMLVRRELFEIRELLSATH